MIHCVTFHSIQMNLIIFTLSYLFANACANSATPQQSFKFVLQKNGQVSIKLASDESKCISMKDGKIGVVGCSNELKEQLFSVEPVTGTTPDPADPVLSPDLKEYCTQKGTPLKNDIAKWSWDIANPVCSSSFCLSSAISAEGLVTVVNDYSFVNMAPIDSPIMEEPANPSSCPDGPALGLRIDFVFYHQIGDLDAGIRQETFHFGNFIDLKCGRIQTATGQSLYQLTEQSSTASVEVAHMDIQCPANSAITKVVCDEWKDAESCAGPGYNGGILTHNNPCNQINRFRACSKVTAECSKFTKTGTAETLVLEAESSWRYGGDLLPLCNADYPFMVGVKSNQDDRTWQILCAKAVTSPPVKFQNSAGVTSIQTAIQSVQDQCIPYINCNSPTPDGKPIFGEWSATQDGSMGVQVINKADPNVAYQKFLFCASEILQGRALPAPA